MSRFFAFCDSTSLHGWPHIPGSSTMQKIFWSLTILAMAVVAIYLCSRFLTKLQKVNKLTPHHTSTVKQFRTSTVSTSLVSSTEPIRFATFPKVVICNKYQIRYGMSSVLKKLRYGLHSQLETSILKEIFHGLCDCQLEH